MRRIRGVSTRAREVVMNDKQLKRQVAVVKGLRKTREIIEDSCEGWKLLGKHVSKQSKKILRDSADGWKQLGEHIFDK